MTTMTTTLRVRACANSSSTHSCGVLRSAGETSSFGGRTASIPRRLSISHCHILCSTHNVTYIVHNNIVIETRQQSDRRGTVARDVGRAPFVPSPQQPDRRLGATGKRDRTNVVVVSSTPVAAALVVALVIVVVV